MLELVQDSLFIFSLNLYYVISISIVEDLLYDDKNKQLFGVISKKIF